MQSLTLDERKELMLRLLEEIDRFCQDNGITYYLTGGTLLGAVRHNGFIPWDDDIDIALRRSDYERLLAEFKSESGDVSILTYKNTKHFIWSAAKIVNNKTVLIENDVKKASIGLNLDMFPLDNVAGDYESVKKYVSKVFKWKNVLTLKYLRLSSDRSLLKNIIVILGKILYLIPDKFIIGRIEKMSRRYENSNDSEFICNMSGAWGVKEILRRADFDESVKHEFEGKQFSIPAGYDRILSSLYGDYMTPPPKEKQVSTHSAVVYWKQ